MLSDTEDIQELQKCSNNRCKNLVDKNGRLSRCLECRTKDTAYKRRSRAQRNKENIPPNASSALYPPPTPLLGTRTPLGPAGVNVELADSDIPELCAPDAGISKQQKVSHILDLVPERAHWLTWLVCSWLSIFHLRVRP